MTDTCINIELASGSVTMPDGSPVSYDGMQQTNFRVWFPKAPMMVFFLQDFTLPGVEVTEVVRATRFVDSNEIGEKMKFGDFTCSFLVDKNFINYREIYSWMKRMTVAGSAVDDSDNPVLIVNNKNMVRFVNAWPKSISSIQFVANSTDVVYIQCTATFNVDYWEFTDSPQYVGAS